MYGGKLLWTGLTLITCARLLVGVPAVDVVGEVIMILGLIVFWLDK